MIDKSVVKRLAQKSEWLGDAEGWTFNSTEELMDFANAISAHQKELDIEILKDLIPDEYEAIEAIRKGESK